MQLNRHFIEGLAQAPCLIGADGEAAVVDPKRDLDDYLADAERAGLKITAILNTHWHQQWDDVEEILRRIRVLVKKMGGFIARSDTPANR